LQLKNSPDWTDAFLFRKWIEISDRQWLPIVVNMGGRLIVDVSFFRQSFFLAVTLSSGQVEWSASPGNHSFEVQSCEQF
jgi:hypothetical protein